MDLPRRLRLPDAFFFDDKQWKLPFGLALSLHVLVFIFLILPAGFLLPERKFQEIQTINLFTASEVKELQAPPKAKATKVKRAPKKDTPPTVKRDVKSIAIDQPEVAASPGKVVSLHPRKLKKKIKEKIKKPPTTQTAKTKEENQRLKALERIQARINQKAEEAKLKHDISRLRESLHTSPTPAEETAEPESTEATESTGTTASSTSNSGGGSNSGNTAFLDEAMKRYYIAISRKIHNHWALPDTQIWDKNLEAVAVIIIQRNGNIAKTFFEKKSKNIYFDQYVVKSIKAAAPLPPFPADLRKKQIEIGLRFRPSGLF